MSAPTDEIIEEIKKYPVLYDTGHPGFRNRKLKEKTWKDVAAEFNLSGPKLETKWKNIKDSYNKHLRCISHRSKRLTVKRNYTKWQWASNMEYFKPFLPFAKPYTDDVVSAHTNNNLGSQLDLDVINKAGSSFSSENYQTQSDIDENFGSITVTDDDPLNIENQCEPTTLEQNAVRANIKLEHNCSDDHDKTAYISNGVGLDRGIDDTELLFLAFAKTVKKLPTRNQILLKMKISQLVMEEELKCQSD